MWTAIALLALLALAHGVRNVHARVVLDPAGIYGSTKDAQKCLNLIWKVGTTALREATPPGAPANCLRFAFHDSGTYLVATDEGGANGSILYELNISQYTSSNGLQQCASLIPTVIELVRTLGCPEATAADVIQVLGAAGVYVTGGPICPMLLGRPDQGYADVVDSLPGNPCETADPLVDSFAAMGFEDPVEALVVLAGAHNIGRSRVTQAPGCSRGLGDMTDAPHSFDGHYYTEVVKEEGKKGWFLSDRALNAPGAVTADLMQLYAVNHTAWLVDWCGFYSELSMLGMDPKPAGFGVRDGWLPYPFVTAQGGPHILGGLPKPLPAVPGVPGGPTGPQLFVDLISGFINAFAAANGRQPNASAGADAVQP